MPWSTSGSGSGSWRRHWRSALGSQGFAVLWALVTLGYAGMVVQRARLGHRWPGLPTVAGLSAIAAVWLEYAAQTRSGRKTPPVDRARSRLDRAVAVALLITLLASLLDALVAVLCCRSIPVGRVLVAGFFAALLRQKILGLGGLSRNRKER